MKRDLFVFAGQSNMMGAGVYPPKVTCTVKDSFEYKHKPRRLGEEKGKFVPAAYPTGEFSYADLTAAYAPGRVNERGESDLAAYSKNTYFCPATSSLNSDLEKTQFPFDSFSEATASMGASLPLFLAGEWEKKSGVCAYAHIAKGGVCISHYLNDEMAREYTKRIRTYNDANGTDFPAEIPARQRMPGAADYCFQKCRDFFADAEDVFPESLSGVRGFFWLQGEGDAGSHPVEYGTKMDVLWEKLKEIGFTHFFCIRVDYFGNPKIVQVMKAQEDFSHRYADAYMLTRAASYFPYAGRDESEWFLETPADEYQNCRDSFFGFTNQHINEKGFITIARHAADNLYRVLKEGKEPILEPELIRDMLP